MVSCKPDDLLKWHGIFEFAFYDVGNDVNRNIAEIIFDSTAIKELEQIWSHDAMAQKESLFPTAWMNSAIQCQRVCKIII